MGGITSDEQASHQVFQSSQSHFTFNLFLFPSFPLISSHPKAQQTEAAGILPHAAKLSRAKMPSKDEKTTKTQGMRFLTLPHHHLLIIQPPPQLPDTTSYIPSSCLQNLGKMREKHTKKEEKVTKNTLATVDLRHPPRHHLLIIQPPNSHRICKKLLVISNQNPKSQQCNTQSGRAREHHLMRLEQHKTKISLDPLSRRTQHTITITT